MKTTAADRKGFLQGFTLPKSTGSHSLPPKEVPDANALSARHHRETIKFDLQHASEHIAHAQKHKDALAKLSKRQGKGKGRA